VRTEASDWPTSEALRGRLWRITFTLEPVAGAGAAHETKVAWSFDGSNVYMMRVMSVFVNLDKFMVKHFEDGLENLKSAAEGRKPKNRKGKMGRLTARF
jgi:hypothetical protein